MGGGGFRKFGVFGLGGDLLRNSEYLFQRVSVGLVEFKEPCDQRAQNTIIVVLYLIYGSMYMMNVEISVTFLKILLWENRSNI